MLVLQPVLFTLVVTLAKHASGKPSLALSESSHDNTLLTRDSTVTGACTCSTTFCEHTAHVQACGGQRTVGSDTAVYCSVGDNGNQQIFGSYSDFVYNQNPSHGCSASSISTEYCTCATYQGTNFGNMTIQQYNKNAQGYVTDVSYYNNVEQQYAPCYCDVQAYYSPQRYGNLEESTLVGYYTLGSDEEPIYCTDVAMQLTQNSSSSIEKFGNCGFYIPGNYETLCHCTPSSNTPTGNARNYTTAKTAPSASQYLINLVAAQIQASKKNQGGTSSSSSSGGGGGGGKSGSISTGGSNSNTAVQQALLTFALIGTVLVTVSV